MELRHWGALDLPQESVSREPNGYGRVRTDDLQVKSPLLYQLSYIPIELNFQGAGGLSTTWLEYHRLVSGGRLVDT